jgi:tetratricopeptide (TPR) repeat protein
MMSRGEQGREAAQHFESLKDRWQRVIEAGQLEEAEEVIEEACQWARAHGDDRQVDSAVCALAAVAIQLGRGEKELPRLREILLRSSDTANCRLAAYHISVYYQYAKNYKRSLFYARIARDRSELLQRADWNASSRNQLGNALLGDSSVGEAAGEYELALALMPREAAIWRARILNNLGYCRALQGRFPEAYTLLYESLRILRRSGAQRYQITTRLDLCYTHLETGRYRLAARHGRIALALAERAGEVEGVKNALYLLGEAANLIGDLDTAYSYFTRLQGEFFPGVSSLPGFLLAVDVRKLVNLHA